MVSKKPPVGTQILILVKCKYCMTRWEYLYTCIIIWVNTILNHIDTRVILPMYEGSYMVYVPESGQGFVALK